MVFYDEMYEEGGRKMDIEESGDPIEDIVEGMIKHLSEKWVGPSKIYMIPEYYEFKFNNNPKPLLKLIEKAKEEGKKLKMWWYE